MLSADFIQRFHNAKTAIRQIRAGEWEPQFNTRSNDFLSATRGGLTLWISNGPLFCEIQGEAHYFGYLFRHWVWRAAVVDLRRHAWAARAKGRPATPVLEDLPVRKGG